MKAFLISAIVSLHILSVSAVNTNDSLFFQIKSSETRMNNIVAGLYGEPQKQIKCITNEIIFYTNLRLTILHKLSSEIYNTGAIQLTSNLIKLKSGINNLNVLIDNLHKNQLKYTDLINAKKIGAASDNIFKTLEATDIIIKEHIISRYISADEISVLENFRVLKKVSPRARLWVLTLSGLLLCLCILGFVILKVRVIKHSFLFISLIILSFISVAGLLFPLRISLLMGEKNYIPSWETLTLHGNQDFKTFSDACKEGKASWKIKTEGTVGSIHYILALYTCASEELACDVYNNFRFINAIIFPPANIPDSTQIDLMHKNRDILFSNDPAWYSNHNFSKIKDWNRMLGRKLAKGSPINFESYNLRLNYLLNDTFLLNEWIPDKKLFSFPMDKIRLTNMLKLKIAL